MTEQSVTEYRLDQLEQQQKEFRSETKEALDELKKQLSDLPEKLDARFATKAEVKEVDAKVDTMAEEQKTRRTAIRGWQVGLGVAGFSVGLGALITFITWVVGAVVKVQGG